MEHRLDTATWPAEASAGHRSGNPNTLVHNNISLFPQMPRENRAAMLAKVVQSEILPRLAAAHTRPASTFGMAGPEKVTTEGDTRALVALLLANPAIDAITFIENLRQRGATPASLLLGIVPQAAQMLGTLWEEDLCGFGEVTIALCHLQQVVRALSPSFQSAALVRSHADTALLVPAPGEQHTLGLVLLSEFFRRDGWHVTGGPNTTAKEAIAAARNTWVDVVAFSIGSSHLLQGLTACIATIRRVSSNRGITVMVGGPMLLTHPDLVQRTGADAAAVDALGAVREARALLQFHAAAD
jgi:methanogenic corrinoid protein MtbC1